MQRKLFHSFFIFSCPANSRRAQFSRLLRQVLGTTSYGTALFSLAAIKCIKLRPTALRRERFATNVSATAPLRLCRRRRRGLRDWSLLPARRRVPCTSRRVHLCGRPRPFQAPRRRGYNQRIACCCFCSSPRSSGRSCHGECVGSAHTASRRVMSGLNRQREEDLVAIVPGRCLHGT
jgi:hypothetical protein